jgi:ABC-type transport system involved in multi-copper enzyme maturation permease subunit
MTMLRVEVRRLCARRMSRTIGAVLLVGLLAAPPLVDWAFRERTRIERDADLERCVQDEPPKIRDGVTMATIPDSVTSPAERQRACATALPERDGTFRLRDIGEVLRPVGALLILAAFAIGASAVGADWQAGFIPTLLTWEGRRRRVFTAKLLASALTILAVLFMWQAILTATLAGLAVTRDAAESPGWQWVQETSGLGLRIAVLAAGSAAIGGAIAMLGRSTAAALGGGLAYVLVLETVLSSNFKPLRPWLLLGNGIVFVKGQFEGGPSGDIPGRTVVAAAVILGVYATAAVLIAARSFTRTDVT